MTTLEDKNYEHVRTPDMIAELTDLASVRGNGEKIKTLTDKVNRRIKHLDVYHE